MVLRRQEVLRVLDMLNHKELMLTLVVHVAVSIAYTVAVVCSSMVIGGGVLVAAAATNVVVGGKEVVISARSLWLISHGRLIAAESQEMYRFLTTRSAWCRVAHLDNGV